MPGEAENQQELLRLIPAGVCLTMDQLASSTALTRRQIAKAVGRLIMRGLVERVEIGCYQITEEGVAAMARGTPLTSGPRGPRTGPQVRRKGTYRARLWRAMRMKRVFTVLVLMELAARDGRDDANGAQKYVLALRRAGYVMRLPGRVPGTAPTSNGYAKYMLVKDTGHLWPLMRRTGVYDQNSGETVPMETQS